LKASAEEITGYSENESDWTISNLRGGWIREIDERHLKFDEPAITRSETEYQPPKHLPSFVSFPNLKDGPLVPEYDITFVKSPKGSGKTEWLCSLVDRYKDAGVSVLLIGHRRALISATAKRLKLTCYLKEATDGENNGAAPSYNAATPHFATCVDSLLKLDTKATKYDVVIIDEIEQVFAHLVSSTLKEHRREALHILRHYLNNAKAMYLLDADLNRATIEILDAMLDDRERAFQALVNGWRASNKVIHLYNSVDNDHLIGDLAESVRRKEKCFVCSNSKSFIIGLEAELHQRVSHQIKTIAITSDNSTAPAVQAFVHDIKKAALEYDVILTSPALGTGIDITFDGDAQMIDKVYGFFQARINTHFDIDQQLSRVRNPKRINVWISSEEFNFETDIEAIKAELHASESEHRILLHIERDGTKVYHLDRLYDTVFSTITAVQRASKNRLRKNFIELRESEGWTVEPISHDNNLSKAGKNIRQCAKSELQKVEYEKILHAEKITIDTYDFLKKAEKAEKLKDADKPSMRRFEVESFYLHDVDLALLTTDDHSSFRRTIKNYEMVMSSDDDLADSDRFYESDFVSDRPQRLLKKSILTSLFRMTGLMHGETFDSSVLVDSSKLTDFSIECRNKKDKIERLFDIPVRHDVFKKPVAQLQMLLKLVGLALVKQGRDQTNGQSRTLYGISEQKLELVQYWASRRATVGLREEWEQQRTEQHNVENDIPRIVRYNENVIDPLDET
jgi:hypothetical protein